MNVPAMNLIFCITCFLCVLPGIEVAKSGRSDLIVSVTDVKEFKKLLRTRTNVLAIYARTEKDASKQMTFYSEVAEAMRGLATLAMVDCTSGKKLCKKMKVAPSTVVLKHYKDGEFNKDYDRKNTLKSMTSFLRDPTGDIPWDEDAAAQDVVHIDSKPSLIKLLHKEKRPILVMYYAPWCGFCKKLKPDYSEAATELKGEAVMAGMDVDKPENYEIRQDYNITGFPTILYYEHGKLKYKYGGENNKDGFVKWMRDPQPPKEDEKEEQWSDIPSDVEHLTEDTFDDFISENPSVLVMLYAPWCGHCKAMKPEYTQAAATMKEEGIPGALAAVDATKEKKLGERFKVKGFPTVKYFEDGKEVYEVNERTADKIIEFMKNPQAPPPPEPSWEETPSEVQHLNEENFKSFLKKKKHALVMFYAPWCGHCKKAKPEIMRAAEQFKENTKVVFAGVDCTKVTSVCSAHDVTGYPTFKYFNYGKDARKYQGGREEADFVNFMNDPSNPSASEPPPSPSAESQWAELDGSEHVQHLTDDNFDSIMQQQESVLVMFYAPWCGHCNAMKPAYAEAAKTLQEENINGILAAVDSTVNQAVSSRFEVKGFPTIKYFKNGKVQMEYDRARTREDLVDFMKNPVAQPPPPPETRWQDTPSNVNHLDQKTFDSFLQDKEHVLTMFYAPWCGHCKQAKPFFQEAAEELKNAPDRFLAAVDCTENAELCSAQSVQGYPSFMYYTKGKFVQKYNEERSKEGFLAFLSSPPLPKDEL